MSVLPRHESEISRLKQDNCKATPSKWNELPSLLVPCNSYGERSGLLGKCSQISPSNPLQPHFCNQKLGFVNLVGDPQNVADVHADRATVVGVPSKIVDRCLEGSVKVHADQLTL